MSKIERNILDTVYKALVNGLAPTANNPFVTVSKLANYDGFQQTRYRDEYVAGEWLAALGSTTPDDVTANINGINIRLKAFDGVNTTEWMSNMFEINHDVDITALNAETVKLEWHVHFLPSDNNAGDVKWHFEYIYLPNGGGAISQATVTAIKTVDANTQYTHLIVGAELPKPAGGYNIGDLIVFNIKRIPTDNEDTYGSDAYFIKTALHVPVDGTGSRQRYIK